MAIWDYNIFAYHEPEVKSAALHEEWTARERNGFVRQTDWWAINARRDADNFSSVPRESIQDFLISSSKDVRHVAVLLSPEAHLDPYDLKPIFEAAPMDGSTFLAHYIFGLSDILETHYASGSPFAHHPFIKEGRAQWEVSAFGAEDLEHAARLVGTVEQQFSFDCGRKHLLYEALEQDLMLADVKPDWFVPSRVLLPYDGEEPECAFTFWDTDVFKEPSNYQRPLVDNISLSPATKKTGILSRLWGSHTRH